MKKLALLFVALGVSVFSHAQILDSLGLGAASVKFEIIAPSNYEDFSASLYGEKLLFVSSRETSLFSKKYDYNKQKFFDLFLYDLNSKEVSRYGDQLSSLEESKYHLGPASLLPDSAGIVLSRNYRIPNLEDEVNFYLVYENWATGERYKLPFCTMANSFQHPFYDAKSRRLYFSANLPDGPGGYDIYYSEFLKDGSWGSPILVEGVNGPRDDVFPTISKDGTLYFSKTVSQMGLDLFAFKNGETKSLSAPLITSRDEFSLIALNKDSAVFSQSQQGRFNTALVLAWIDSKETTPTTVTQEYLVYIKVDEDQNPWSLADILTNKYPEQNIYVGKKDGEIVVVAKGSSPESEALEANNELIDSSHLAFLTTEPIEEIGRPINPELEVDALADALVEPQSSKDPVTTTITESSEEVIEPKTEGSDDAMAAVRLKEETLLHVVYPIDGNIEEAQIKLEQMRSSSEMAGLSLGEVNGELVLIVSTNGTRNDAEKIKALAQERGLASSYLTTVMPNKVDYTTEVPNIEPTVESDGASYSTIVGVFGSLELAQNHYKSVKNWSSNAFISKHDGKYYVVSSDYKGEKSAVVARDVARDNGIDGAWLFPQKLEPLNVPSLSASPDVVVYFRFDKYNVQEKYAHQIDDVVAQLPENIENVYMVGHTDSRGSSLYNETLSRNRVEEVASYLESRHPSLKVLQTLDSRGEFELTNDCGDGIECDEYAHFLNRRVEIWFY